MKTHPIPFMRFGLVILSLLLAAAIAPAQPRFAITSTTIDGGGDRTAEPADPKDETPRFILTGTIGQPDAAAPAFSEKPRFSLQSGFWNDYHAVQTPGAPQLTIRKGAPGFVVLAWPVSVEGFGLQQSPDLTPESWSAVLIPVVDTATEHTVTVPINAPRMFFSLKAL